MYPMSAGENDVLLLFMVTIDAHIFNTNISNSDVYVNAGKKSIELKHNISRLLHV